MRVKGSEPASDDITPPQSLPYIPPASTASTSQPSTSTTTTPFSSMGYTGATAPVVTYPPGFPNFLDLLDDSVDQDGDIDDTDSPMPPGLEDDFLEMLSNTDFDWPPFGGPGPSQGRNGYPGPAPGYPPQYQGQYQFVPYPSYGNQYYGQYPLTGPSVYGVNPPAKPSTSQVETKQEKMDTSDDQPVSIANGARDMDQTVANKDQEDALKAIAKKVGISTTESENSNDSSDGTSVAHTPEQRIATPVQSPAPSPSGIADSRYVTVGQLPGVGSSHSASGAQFNSSPPLSVSPTSSPTRTTKRTATLNTKKPAAKSSVADSINPETDVPVSPSASSRSKSTIKVDVDEIVLIEEAKSRPIRHRKEPDIEETKGRSVRNAINARVNRQKHKIYVDTLEQEVDDLKGMNSDLEQKNEDLQNKMLEMQKHVKYLENVIANDTALARVLGALTEVEDVRLSSSFARKRKRSADTTSGIKKPGPEAEVQVAQVSGGVTGGVCLHVDQKNVSIEYCEKCSKKAYDNFHSPEDST